MKAISIKNPYAQAIIAGEKTIEVRSWRTAYRGRLVIVSSKTPVYRDENFLNGHALGEVDLIEIRSLTVDDAEAAGFEPEDFEYLKGQYAWVLSHPRSYKKPYPQKGRLYLYDIEPPKGHITGIRLTDD